MKTKRTIGVEMLAIAFIVSVEANAQSETADSLLLRNPMPTENAYQGENIQDLQRGNIQDFHRTMNFAMPTKSDAMSAMNYSMPQMGIANPFFKLWSGASIAVNGATGQMPGLMDMATGNVSLRQDFGRLHLSASAIANKYWMPMQNALYSQYGYGGTARYDLSEAITLHAFGYYYAGNPLVGPAFSPYVSTTSFGGYADVRFSEHFGSSMGVRRYINPMSGRWTTEPIVTPYVKIGKAALGLPVGGILKSLIWGDSDNPTRFRPQPLPPRAAPPNGAPRSR